MEKNNPEIRFTKTIEANSIVLSHMILFVETVLSYAKKSNIEAIVVEGSFGRGEGGVLQTKTGFEPVNDYDLLLVVDVAIKPTIIEEIKTVFKSKTEIWRIDIAQYTFGKLSSLKPTLRNYDLKYGSIVLFGNPGVFSNLPKWEAKQIHIREAEKLLFTREISFVLALYKNEPPKNETLNFLGIQQLSKAVIAAADSHLMISGIYNHSYQVRKELLLNSSVFTKDEKELIDWAFEFKLYPTRHFRLTIKNFYEKCLNFYLRMFNELGRKMYGYHYFGYLHYDLSCLMSFRKWAIIIFYKTIKNNTNYYKSLLLSLSQYYLLQYLSTNSDQMLLKSFSNYRKGYGVKCNSKEQLIKEIVKVRMC